MQSKSFTRALLDGFGLGAGRKDTFGLLDGAKWRAITGRNNFTGKRVTVDGALQLSTAWACVRLISETLSTLPMILYRDAGEAKAPARDHALYAMLHHQPNAYMTAVVFWQAFVSSMLLWGAAYVEKRRTGQRVTSFDFLHPEQVTRRTYPGGAVEWSYVDPSTGERRVIPADDMWFTPAFTVDGVNVVSPISMGANVMGGAMAADEASASTFLHGMKATGLVTMDMAMTAEQREQVRQHVNKVSRFGGFMVLEKGMGFQQLTMTPHDSELLATRAFNIEEICRWFRVPPFMVGHSEKSTSWGTGIEQQMIGFVTFVLRPWAVRIEQSINKSLLTPVERLTYGAEFALEGLLRGDSAARAAFYSQMTQNGVMTRDECRRLENLPLMGGNAAALTVQSNLLPIDMLGQAATAAEPAQPQDPTP